MSFYLFWVAAVVCLVSVYIHGVWGRAMHATAIKASDLPELTASVAMAAWDVFTVMLLVSGLSLLYVAYNPDAVWMAYPIMAMHLGGAGVFGVLIISGHGVLLRLPGAYLMGSTGLVTALAL